MVIRDPILWVLAFEMAIPLKFIETWDFEKSLAEQNVVV
jgi:hypothetical protein